MPVSPTAQTKAEPQPAYQWPSQRAQAIFSFATPPIEDDNKRYRKLIERERKSQKLTYVDIAARIGLTKQRIWRLLNTDTNFPVPERDAILAAVGIDLDRARMAVSYFRDIDMYAEVCGLNIAYACATLARQFIDRREELHITIPPTILDEAIGRTFKMLLRHQDQVMQNSEHLVD